MAWLCRLYDGPTVAASPGTTSEQVASGKADYDRGGSTTPELTPHSCTTAQTLPDFRTRLFSDRTSAEQEFPVWPLPAYNIRSRNASARSVPVSAHSMVAWNDWRAGSSLGVTLPGSYRVMLGIGGGPATASIRDRRW
jgi:hypothetical protein